jgi:hypothetical protein
MGGDIVFSSLSIPGTPPAAFLQPYLHLATDVAVASAGVPQALSFRNGWGPDSDIRPHLTRSEQSIHSAIF